MYEIRLFGSPSILRDGIDLQASLPEQASAILCYLLLNRERSLHRDIVAVHFWEDASQDKARKALRTALWRIRSTLEDEDSPPILLAESDYVSFNTDIDYWLDAEAFTLLIEQAQAFEKEGREDESIPVLEEAVGLYRADLLEGWTDEWLLYQRVHLESLYLTALMDLMSFHSRKQEYQKSLQYGMRILNNDSLLESVHRHMMRLHYWAGNRPAAVRQYQQCRDYLDREMGIEPMEETRLLYEYICHENASALTGMQEVLPTEEGSQNLQVEAIIRQLKIVQDQLQIAQQQLEIASGNSPL